MFGIIKILTFAGLMVVAGCANHYRTPESAIRYYWACMAESNAGKVLETQVYYEPGMTSEYIHPPANIEWLYLDSLSTDYQGQGRARVYYQVVFKKNGQAKTTRYATGTMIIKRDGQWKVGAPVGARKKKAPAKPDTAKAAAN